MHILIIPSWYPRNPTDVYGSFFREQAIALAKNNQVGVIALIKQPAKKLRSYTHFSQRLSFENDAGVNTIRKPLVNIFAKLPRVYAFQHKHYGVRLFDEYVSKFGFPDILHVHSILYGGYIALHIHQKYQIPFVITEHSTFYARKLHNKYQEGLIKNVAKSASKKLAVSKPLSKLLSDCVQIANNSWDVMPNMVDPLFLNYNKIKDGEGDSFVFITISFHHKKKNIDILIKSFKIAFECNDNVKLIIGGYGPETNNLKLLVKQLDMQKCVEFSGLLERDQVAKYITNSDCFVLPSQFETFGVVLIEAMALGKPVIASKCGGPEDIINEKNGLFVKTNDIGDLSEKMKYMHHNSWRFNGNEIKEDCASRYASSVIARKLTDIYEDVIGSENKSK
jgi:glycosyltransferase involved in cell wall biosynthesis